MITGRRNTGEFKKGRPHYQAIENAANLFTDAIVCNSRRVKRDVEQREAFARKKVHVIPNAVDFTRFVRNQPLDLRSRYPELRGAGCIVGTVGNLKHQKRHDRFLRALAQARRADPAIKGIIVGRDLGMERSLRELVMELNLEGNVVLAGGVDDPSPLIMGFDLFALTSDHEGMPNVLLEAMAAGVPIITTKVGGVGELLDKGRLGCLTEKDSADISRAILELSRDESRRNAMKEKARSHALRHFGPEALAARHMELYERIQRA